MTLKHTVVGAIIALLLSVAAFLWGMNYTITHMEVETNPAGKTAMITLNDQIYIHDLSAQH